MKEKLSHIDRKSTVLFAIFLCIQLCILSATLFALLSAVLIDVLLAALFNYKKMFFKNVAPDDRPTRLAPVPWRVFLQTICTSQSGLAKC